MSRAYCEVEAKTFLRACVLNTRKNSSRVIVHDEQRAGVGMVLAIDESSCYPTCTLVQYG